MCKNHPFVHSFLNIVAITVNFSSHCCLLSVNYLSPESLSLCHQRETGEVEQLIWSLSLNLEEKKSALCKGNRKMGLTQILPWENCSKAKLVPLLWMQHSSSISQLPWQ